MATPHINAPMGAFAKTVLMPGDPLRAKFIAENFLENPELVNNVRGVHGYTGTYKGVRVSVMASGMGMPSMGIYSHELFNFYGVENIMRIGSAGAISPKVKLHDIVVGMGACTNSNYLKVFKTEGTFAPIADYTFMSTLLKTADELGQKTIVGNICSGDNFYGPALEEGDAARWQTMGVLAVEMEAAALYGNAAYAGKRALAICTISDNLTTNEHLPPQDRETGFSDMVTLALETAVAMDALPPL